MHRPEPVHFQAYIVSIKIEDRIGAHVIFLEMIIPAVIINIHGGNQIVSIVNIFL